MGSEAFRTCMTVEINLEQSLGTIECIHRYFLTIAHLLVVMLLDHDAEIFPHIGKHAWHSPPLPHKMTKAQPKKPREGTQ